MKKFLSLFIVFIMILSFSTAFAEDDPAGTFDVLQTAGIRPLWGVSGIAVLAKFDGAPGKIYVAREIIVDTDYKEGHATSYLPSCVAKVVDPNGNIVALHDFSHMEKKGKEYYVFNIQENIPGVWKIQIMNGRKRDLFSIGFNGTDIWGIRGEKVLGKSKTLPEQTWIYAHDKVDYFYTSVSEDAPITLYDAENNVVATSEPTSRAYIKHKIYTKSVKPNTAYRVDYGTGYYGEIEIDGVPGLLCPSKAAAEALKGGWTTTGGITVQGPLQKRAREEIVRLIAEKDLSYTYEKPKSMPKTLENPMAEAQLFGSYGIIGGIDFAVNNQILDTKSAYLGITSGETFTVPELNGQHGYYSEFKNCATTINSMAGVTELDLELNYLKGNQALIQRAAIGLLGIVAQLTEDDSLRVNNLTESYVVMRASMFTMDPFVQAYQIIRDKIDEQTREILDQAIFAAVDKMGNYVGQGPTNQALFCMTYTIRAYDIFRLERYHNTFKRQVESLINNTDNQHGITDLGYFIESGGCDSGYEYMNRYHYYSLYEFYKRMTGADAVLVSKMKTSIQKTLEFESFFWAPQPYESGVTSIDPTAFTSRTSATGLGTDNYPGYSLIWDEFPFARRRFEMQSGRKLENTTAISYPHRINSEDWAWKQIERYWKKYDKEFTDGGGLRNWPLASYYAFNAVEWCQPAENLPYEAKDRTIWEDDGFIAFKHKGVYGTVFYGVDISTDHDTYSLMGGGPTFLWGEGVGKTLVSRKHRNYEKSSGKYRVDTVDDIVASCVYGQDVNKNLTMYSGKEGTAYYGGLNGGTTKDGVKYGGVTFKWVTPGSTFEISGQIPDGNKKYDKNEMVFTDQTITWQYILGNDGVTINVSLTGMKQGQSYWVNLPITGTSLDPNISTEYEKGKLTVKNGRGRMTYEWDKALSSDFTDEVEKTNRLRIKLSGKGKATIKITNQTPDCTISEMGLYKDISLGDVRLTEKLTGTGENQYISYRIRNNTKTEKAAKMLIAHYDEYGKLAGIIAEKKIVLPADAVTRVISDALPIEGKTGEIRAFVWMDDGKIYPVVPENRWTIS